MLIVLGRIYPVPPRIAMMLFHPTLNIHPLMFQKTMHHLVALNRLSRCTTNRPLLLTLLANREMALVSYLLQQPSSVADLPYAHFE